MMQTRMPLQPCFEFRMFVSSVVVDDQMQVKLRHSLTINRLLKLDPLLMAVSLLVLRDHCAVGDAQHGKQRRRAMTLVVVSHRFQSSGEHRQTFLRSIQCLDLTFLIN